MMNTEPPPILIDRAIAWIHAPGRRKIFLAVLGLAGFFGSIVALSLLAPSLGPQWDWLGLGPDAAAPPGTSIQIYQPAKTLWDWLQLLLVPAIISFIGLWFTRRESRVQTELQETRTRDATLQAYFDQMSVLLLDKELRAPQGRDDARTIARSRTITALRLLDGPRKAAVLRFLHESGIVSQRVPHPLNLREADFSQIDLSGADLSYAALGGVSLFAAKLRLASLVWADLSDADLRDADLTDADLAHASMRRARVSSQTRLSRKWQLVYQLHNPPRPGLPTRDVRLVRVDLHDADLRGADLRDVDLRGLDASSANFADADLRQANLESTLLNGATLDRADLSGARLRGAKLVEASLVGVNLRQADLGDADLSGATLVGADLGLANLAGAVAEQTVFDPKWETVYRLQNRLPAPAGAASQASLAGQDLSDAYLADCKLSGVDLRAADLSGANLQAADLSGANLSGANLRHAKVVDADLRGANLTGANLQDFPLLHVRIDDATQLDPKWRIVREIWQGAAPSLERADLENANLSGAYLFGAKLSGANLRGADLRGANLRGADLRGADLRGANLALAELVGATISPNTRMDPKWQLVWGILNRSQFDRDLRGSDLQDAFLRDANLRGANLQRSNLRGADLRGADLRGADLSGADARGALLASAHYNRQTILPEGFESWQSRALREE